MIEERHEEFLELSGRGGYWFPCREPERRFDILSVFIVECPGCIRAARVIATLNDPVERLGVASWDGEFVWGEGLAAWADRAEEYNRVHS